MNELIHNRDPDTAALREISARHGRGARLIDEQVRIEVARIAAVETIGRSLDALPRDFPPRIRKVTMQVGIAVVGMIKRL